MEFVIRILFLPFEASLPLCACTVLWPHPLISSAHKMVESSSPISTYTPSDVWKHFKKINDQPKVRCITCGNIYVYRGGTTNLRNYLMAKHLIIYTADSKSSKKSLTMQNKLDFKHHKRSEKKSKEITYRILYMICANLRPLRMVSSHYWHT